jgi:hypothetical protein
MLGKEAWGLITTPNSLHATTLKAKYFPNAYLLNANLKKGSSKS